MPILGPDGNPVKSIQIPVAYPSRAGGSTSITDRRSYSQLAGNLSPSRLALILRQAEDGDAEEFLELAEDLEEQDAHYMGILTARKRQVAELEITVEASGDDKAAQTAADLVKEWLDRESLQDELFHLMDALGKGYSALEISWETSASRWWPQSLDWRDPRLFRFDQKTGRQLRLRGLARSESDQDLPPYRFVVHQAAAKSGIPIRGGLARVCAWLLMIKRFTLADWAAFAEVFGQPLKLGKYDASATEADIKVLWRALRGMSREAAAAIPESMAIEFLSPSGSGKSGPEVYERLARYADEQLSKAVLGQTTTTDAIGGGHAVSKEHRKVAEDIERSDARDLAATLNRQVIRPLIAFNLGPQEVYPRIRIGRPEERNLEAMLEAVEKLSDLGLRVSANQVRKIYRLEEPADDDDILQKPQAPEPEPQSEASALALAAAQGVANPLEGLEADIEALPESEWQELVKGPIRTASEALDVDDPTAARGRLADAVEVDPDRKAVNRIARATFVSRVAGLLGLGERDA